MQAQLGPRHGRRRRPMWSAPPLHNIQLNSSTCTQTTANGALARCACHASHPMPRACPHTASACRPQFRYANAHFYDTLRSWPRCRDVKESTPPDWRVSAEDPFGGNRTAGGVCGAYGHDMSTNDADGWKRSSVPYVESTFRGGLRDYKGVDVGYTEEGGVKKQGDGKEKKHMAGTNLGNIYRSSKQCNCLSTARADEHFLGSLRSESRKSTDDYQRTRRANLNLPQFSSLTPEQLTKAKRVFATIGAPHAPRTLRTHTPTLTPGIRRTRTAPLSPRDGAFLTSPRQIPTTLARLTRRSYASSSPASATGRTTKRSRSCSRRRMTACPIARRA